LDYARQFFDEMPSRDVVSWTGILSAYVKHEKHEEALGMFQEMMGSGPCPNEFTFSSVLRACSALGEFSDGKCIHGCVIKHGFESNQILGSVLIDLYSKYGSIEEACRLFSCVDNGDVVSWTTMISSLVQAGKWSPALRIYIDMIKAGVYPNEFTFVKVLAAAGFLGLKHGKVVHAHLIVFGVELNLVVKTALVHMYSKCQRMDDAVRISKLTPESDRFLWTAILSGLAQNLKLREAVVAFQEMEASGILSNNFTYLSILNACSLIVS
jgi:pentatricopeptide repeat protein